MGPNKVATGGTIVNGSIVYFIREEAEFGGGGAIKIGTTASTAEGRLCAMRTGNPRTMRVLAVIPGDRELEQRLHQRFAALRLRGDREWFASQEPLLSFIDGVLAKDPGCVQRDAAATVDAVEGLPIGAFDALRGFEEARASLEAFDVATLSADQDMATLWRGHRHRELMSERSPFGTGYRRGAAVYGLDATVERVVAAAKARAMRHVANRVAAEERGEPMSVCDRAGESR